MVYHRILNVVLCAIVVGILVTKSCPALCNPMDYSPPGSSVHRISQARILGCHFLLWVLQQRESSPHWPHLEKARVQQGRPSASKRKKKIDISKAPAPIQPIMVIYTVTNHLVYEINLFSLLAFVLYIF